MIPDTTDPTHQPDPFWEEIMALAERILSEPCSGTKHRLAGNCVYDQLVSEGSGS